jgi:CO/xanthine dehydrogenase FAD-binding subunit
MNVTLQTYFTPESTAEALALKAAHGHALHVIAGGTMLMPQYNEGRFFPELVMGLRRAGMNHVQVNGAAAIGATTTLTQMVELQGFPLLSQAAAGIGGWAVRNMATVGGNLFNQAPYGDLCTALLALDARLKVENRVGARLISLEQFLKEGRVLAPDELVTEIQIPRPQGKAVYRKFGRRAANAATIVTVAAVLDVADGIVQAARIALGGADSVTIRSGPAEESLLGKALDEESIVAAAAAAADASNPVTDPVATAWYRRRMVAVQLAHALREIAASIREESE